MPATTARFETPNADRYLGQLCKHFAHKIEVEQTGSEGRFTFPPGRGTAAADSSGLVLRAEAGDGEGLARVQHILEDHLLRFAFRENPEPLTWTEAEVR